MSLLVDSSDEMRVEDDLTTRGHWHNTGRRAGGGTAVLQLELSTS